MDYSAAEQKLAALRQAGPQAPPEEVPDWLKPQAPSQSSWQIPQPAQPAEDTIDFKGFLQSKTVWAGICTAAVSLLGYFQASDAIQQNPGATSLLGFCMGALMVLLRLVSSQPVAPPTIMVRGQNISQNKD